MRKAKIMLLAIVVITIVGGVLAFKAKRANGLTFCTTLGISGATPIDFLCPMTIQDVTFSANPTWVYVFYVGTDADDFCPQADQAIQCRYTGFMETEGD